MKYQRNILSFLIVLMCLTNTLKAHVPVSAKRPVKTAPRSIQSTQWLTSIQVDADTLIMNLLDQVNEDSILRNIRHLQDYGTRLCTSPQALQAQNWLQSKLTGYGMITHIQHLSLPVGSSGNVIATLTGCTYPDEYIVLGAHYDSYSDNSLAPGADDNASGVSGILEIARVLSGQTFDRSILLCLWAAEEYGLYGSMAFAQQAADSNLNILGYLNLDMCGYQVGTDISTNVAGPASAQTLLDLYQDVCSVYLPSFVVTFSNNLPGSSDYASFNAAGYMGIFPFEDEYNYSPYIHTIADTVGLSVNSLPKAATFTRSVMATALEMAVVDNTGVGVETEKTAYHSTLCIPNPFHENVQIDFYQPENGKISLNIYNNLGQLIHSEFQDIVRKGKQTLTVEGSSLKPGIYYYRLMTGKIIYSGTMIKAE